MEGERITKPGRDFDKAFPLARRKASLNLESMVSFLLSLLGLRDFRAPLCPVEMVMRD